MTKSIKLIIFLSLIISLFFAFFLFTDISYAQTTCSRNSSSSGSSAWSGCSYGASTHYYVVQGYYSTQAEALAAANAGLGTLIATYGTPTSSIVDQNTWPVDGLTASTMVWGSYRAAVNYCGPSGTRRHFNWYYFFVKDTWIDTDNDCSLDDILNGDCNSTYYHVNLDVRNSSDDILYAETINSRGQTQSYGDPAKISECLRKEIGDCTVNYYNPVNYDVETGQGDWNPANQMCDIETDLGVSATSEGAPAQTETPPDVEKGTAGQAGDPSDTQAQALDKIADNTKETANNTDGLQDSANNIEAQLKLANDKLEQLNNSQGSGDPTTSVNAQSQISNTPDDASGSESTFGYDSGDLPEDGVISNVLQDVADASPIQAIKDQIDYTAVDPICEITGSFMLGATEVNYTFDFCSWEYILDMMGVVIFVFSVLYAFWILFR